MEIFYRLIFCLCFSWSVALPTQSTEDSLKDVRVDDYFASDASQLIAINLLKSYIDIDANQVHSPLGVTSVLAVLAEGAAGDTFEEFNKVFGYPKERSALRTSFKRLLSKYQNRVYKSEPSFQQWLYIYRNFSACQEFKQIIADNYYVEVKDISRDEYDWSEPSTSLEATTVSNSKDVVGFETLKRIKLDDDEPAADSTTLQDSYGEEVLVKDASKFDRFVDDKQYVEKPVILDEIKHEQEKEMVKEKENEKVKENENEKEKEKEVQEQMEKEKEKQPQPIAITEKEKKDEKLEKLEKLKETQEASGATPSLQTETMMQPAENLDTKDMTKREDETKREDDLNPEENETVHDDEKIEKLYTDPQRVVVPIQEVLDSNEPEKVSLPLETFETAFAAAAKSTSALLTALESHMRSVKRVYGGRSLFKKDDIASALSANSITGREAGSKTKMLLFNGLYYRGNWATPFLAQPISNELFYMTTEDTVNTPMMHAKGKFYITEIDHLKAKALCLPYENKKYAMLIVLPNEIEGLRAVIEKLQPTDFKFARTNGVEKDLHLTLPKFQVEETTRSEAMLKSLGLQKIFSHQEADLSLLSKDTDLHVDEIVQFANVKVDEGGSSENAFSATNTQARTTEADFEELKINHPFLYFVMDREENFVIASGKVYTPEYKEELPPVTIEVEFEEA